ncbi:MULTISPECIES: 3',5'-nucleoside bisphosphate phosphatase [unclassified Undibacterium]|uniref:3',5'-nucleoside bisphosphate phosphatase n=1 Tax=unclassified Undibacterium TaxID=2630295 RepID=UPI002AC9E71F|nr:MULTISPECIES: 3',5'-nucleoside bisphosphate phosphatase [unclassified Undibacterium]MEB0140938.1 3',5'-nucleoside bisphosphate phosphatase [Undibacterium sp. CCC2.1]MEB0173145.1 3',5'-nucleoside bisphosphate phosphatase [Undibacterium sp. CCC1.1]MEB0177867.1 3',5'-nucleoside bisphosphate phosphatase [Undibacterium sp. CCC3.4]MEB0216148.1 3',5'-nucleoside bisphosphate phosphatase [Undibacterium sp. 5I2]WPX42803.1 3',5'-nucleoside bisphosphate phosphatase [Undibacterium sp. CCC3.4]
MSALALNVDFHSHSTISDGVLTPAALAARAAANGVAVWALTDHDEVSGVAAARAAAAELGMGFVAGVEISITWAASTIHIVGLGIDETNPALLQGLLRTRSGREQRAREMAADLAARAGIDGVYEGALKYVGNPDLISRSHFARYLTEIGACASVSEVFKKYLSEGKPGYVPHRWASLSDALSWIQGAGGVAVVAHPGRYDLSEVARDCFFREFRALGGSAIETVTGSHSVDQYEEYTRIANQYGFLVSRGSDFHSPDDAEVDIGRLPAMPKLSKPVWQDWFSA